MTREEIEEAMGVSEPIQASFEGIGDDVKFIKLIVNGKENIVSIEELENTLSEPCDWISREEVCDYIAEFVNHEYATDRERELVKNIIDGIQHLPSIQPKPKTECSCEQIKWERDIAIEQLHELGYELGQKIEPCEDCISRKQAMKACYQMAVRTGIEEMPYKYAETELAHLPSIQPKPKTDVLDKIRAEIEDKISAYDDRNISEYKDCLEIIDKYKAESEDKQCGK